MFNSTNNSETPGLRKPYFSSTLIDNVDNSVPKNITQPKITSTPLGKKNSVFVTPPKSNVLTPKKYSLSEIVTPPRIHKRDSIRLNNSHSAVGPLLASTKYDVNISTYEGTRSPGLVRRLVQYNEAAEREREKPRPSTHQAKYGSPGMFPIVHLFKRDLPHLERKPNRVTVRLASPDYSRQHSNEYNKRLLEGMIRQSALSPRRFLSQSSGDETNTKSVLDALKEISRKRIHASEEYELTEETGKRIRKERIKNVDEITDSDSNKRQRDDSSLQELSPTAIKPVSKRICMYDEYAASCSSTDYSHKKPNFSSSKRKSISTNTLNENPKESKQVKLINAETQTVLPEPDSAKSDKTSDKVKEKEESRSESEKPVEKRESPVKVFDDAPLERIKQNRLAALMGSLAGKDPVLIPKPDYALILKSPMEKPAKPREPESREEASVDKPLTSILSSPNKSPIKANKHVHFSFPENSDSSTEADQTAAAAKELPKTLAAPPAATETTRSAISFSAFTFTVISDKTETTLQTPALSLPVPTISTESGSVVTSPTTTAFNFKGPLAKSASFPAKSVSKAVLPELAVVPAGAISSSNSVSKSPPKMGGFKFDLNGPSTAVPSSLVASTSAAPLFSFAPPKTEPSTANCLSDKNGAFKTLPKSQTAPSSEGFIFGSGEGVLSKPSISAGAPSMVLPFSSPKTSNAFSPSVSSPFKLNSAGSDAKAPAAFSSSSAVGFGDGSGSATSTGTGNFVFSNRTAPTTFSSAAIAPLTTCASSTPNTLTTSFSFGTPPTTGSSLNGFRTQPSTTSAPIALGPSLSTSNSFGITSSNTVSNVFNAASPAFGAASQSSPAVPTFGIPATTSATANFGSSAAPLFNTNKSSPAFGTPQQPQPSTAGAPFGKALPSFGQTTPSSSFGRPSATSATDFGATNNFGAATSAAPTISNAAGFEFNSFKSSPSTASIFGGTVANAQPAGFGSTNANANANVFGGTKAPSFGSSVPNTTATSFGSASPSTFSFGAKTTTAASNAFGNGGAFGTPTTASSAFGATNSFGSSATNMTSFNAATTQAGGFGSASSPSFGAGSSGFGPAPALPSFGASSATNAFGSASSAAGFNMTSANSAFGKPQAAPNSFGSTTTSSFGSNKSFGTPQTQSNAMFGTAAPATQSGVFSFGSGSGKPAGLFKFGGASSNEPPKPAFNFTAGGNASAPGFGGATGASFGAAPAAGFGSAGATGQFNGPQTGVFSIGAGPSTGRARTQLKAKRRT